MFFKHVTANIRNSAISSFYVTIIRMEMKMKTNIYTEEKIFRRILCLFLKKGNFFARNNMAKKPNDFISKVSVASSI